MARKRPAWKKALMGAGFAAVVLWMVELGLGLAGVAPAYSSEAVAGWRVAGGISGKSIQGPRDGHAFTVSTNGDGLRTELPEAHPEGTLRVAVMGDSTVFGWGVSDGESVADGLQTALREQHPELGAIEVLNGGQPGYSTVQAAWLFNEVVHRWTPDLTVVFLPLHDDNLVLVSDREHLEGARGVSDRLRVGLARHSRIYSLLRMQLFRQAGEATLVAHQGSDGEPRVPRADDHDRSWAIRSMQATAEGWGGEVVVGLLPFLADLNTRTPAPRPSSTWARAWSESTGDAVVDVRGCCGPQGGDLVLPDDPGHLNAEGNRRVGEALADEVAELLAARR